MLRHLDLPERSVVIRRGRPATLKSLPRAALGEGRRGGVRTPQVRSQVGPSVET
jgi:hypothetical protein